jgi:hypothetical protein
MPKKVQEGALSEPIAKWYLSQVPVQAGSMLFSGARDKIGEAAAEKKSHVNIVTYRQRSAPAVECPETENSAVPAQSYSEALGAFAMNDDWYERERLHRAAQEGDIEEMRSLVAGGRDPNEFDDMGQTPLHYAAREEKLDAVRYLLSVGADVDAQDESKIGNTALGEVAATCSLEMARLLLDAGADPTRPGWMQITPLYRASQRERGEGPLVHELLASAAKKRP